jgi:tetratricopeptide (TPR) repeat protein
MKKSARAARQNARATARTDNPGALAVRQAGSVALADAASRSTLLRSSNASRAHSALREIAQQPAQDEQAARRSRSIYEEAAEHSNLGASLEALDRHHEAEAAYRRAIALDPGLAVAHHNLGNLLHKQGHDAEAEAAFRVALTFVEIMRMPGMASAARFNVRGASTKRWTHFATPHDMALPTRLRIAIWELYSSRWTAMPKRWPHCVTRSLWILAVHWHTAT